VLTTLLESAGTWYQSSRHCGLPGVGACQESYRASRKAAHICGETRLLWILSCNCRILSPESQPAIRKTLEHFRISDEHGTSSSLALGTGAFGTDCPSRQARSLNTRTAHGGLPLPSYDVARGEACEPRQKSARCKWRLAEQLQRTLAAPPIKQRLPTFA
jgi:hypothetical protein